MKAKASERKEAVKKRPQGRHTRHQAKLSELKEAMKKDDRFERGAGTSCQNYVRDDANGRTLTASKAKCLPDPECNAIVCPTGKITGCTLRAVANMVPCVVRFRTPFASDLRRVQPPTFG